jgi:putative membrane protein
VFFRKERHVPYSRIQNIDASQGILHRLLGVYNLTLESGSGSEPEATLNVLPDAALAEMRSRVFAGRAATAEAGPQAAAAAPAEPESTVLLQLGLRDLALCGFIRGRGLLMLAAIFSILSQYGIDDEALVEGTPGPQADGRVARAMESMFERGLSFDIVEVLFWFAAFLLLVLLLRVLSMLHTMQMFYRFRLALAAGELRLTFGLLTRVKATIPLGRIQTITIREGPLHRLFGVSSVRAATAGGGPGQAAAGSRYLAPIIARRALPDLVRVLMPQVDLDGLAWQPAHPGAFRRLLVRHAATALIVSSLVLWFAGAWTAPLAAGLLGLAVMHARLQARHFGHSLSRDIFAFRSGWFMRQVTITPLRKVQAVSVSESPFDRRHAMAGLVVDTAGAAGAPHALAVPYLDRAHAEALSAVIAAGAMETALTW